MNLIAVILSIYKSDKLRFVEEAINSLLNQTNSNFELYVLIDGPINEDICFFLDSINNDDVHIIKREENKGLAKSMNELLRNVLTEDYEYIARMDADDISMPNRFERQLAYMDQHKDVDCLGTWAIEIDSHGEEYFRKQMPVTHDECLDLFKKRDCLIHPTVMFRKSYFEKAGLYPEDTYFGEDTIMWAKGFKANCKFANLPEYLLKFRLDENFFKRRAGWKHAKSILSLRLRVNKMLGFGIKANIFAILYASAKMMPKSILKIIYKIAR